MNVARVPGQVVKLILLVLLENNTSEELLPSLIFLGEVERFNIDQVTTRFAHARRGNGLAEHGLLGLT